MRIITFLIIFAALLLSWGCAPSIPPCWKAPKPFRLVCLGVSAGGGLSQNYITGLDIPEDALWDNEDALLPDGNIGFIARPKLKVGLGKNWEAALSGIFLRAGFHHGLYGHRHQYRLAAQGLSQKVWDLNPCHSLAAIPTLAYSDGACRNPSRQPMVINSGWELRRSVSSFRS